MFQTVKVIVLRFVDYKEASRILTVLTEKGEKLTVTAHSRGGFAEPFACSEMTLQSSRGKWYLREAATITEFIGLRTSYEKFELAAYMSKTAETIADSDVPDPNLFRLLARGFDTLAKIGADETDAFQTAFESRIADIAGFASFEEIREHLI
ncbi:MAG: recombination protein O N-terminal domain-containing protein [Oscillospiraceae bacterium]|jgi:DNA repair protein RecO|nr:recombination protein O N-terminal domain-containing protein [Oscillospiraceae bacterium]